MMMMMVLALSPIHPSACDGGPVFVEEGREGEGVKGRGARWGEGVRGRGVRWGACIRGRGEG